MVNKKVPMRMCIACKESRPKSELLRIVKFNDEFDLDLTSKANGRGTYVCDNEECFNKLINCKLLNKAFKENISNDVYNKLKEKYLERK